MSADRMGRQRGNARRGVRQLWFRILLGEVLAVLLVAPEAMPARADLNFGHYLLNNSSTAWLDPANVLYDRGYDLFRATTTVELETGWWDVGNDDMQFIDHGLPQWSQAARGNGGALSNRYHMRFNQGDDTSHGEAASWWTVAPIHYEIIDTSRWCHVTTTFDGARNLVKDTHSANGHPTGFLWLGNTDARLQCDGRYVRGDGYMAWIN